MSISLTETNKSDVIIAKNVLRTQMITPEIIIDLNIIYILHTYFIDIIHTRSDSFEITILKGIPS